LDVNRRVVKGRSGYIHSGTRYDSKKIKATGKIKASSLSNYHVLKDKLNGILVDAEPYYITPLINSDDDLYNFELPGESIGEIDYKGEFNESIGYRFKVVCESGLDISFIGKYSQGLIFNFYIDFITAELPFGETIPKTLDITSKSFLYRGTAINSQLEYPWQLKLTSNAVQPGNFNINLDGRIFVYNSDIQIVEGDEFIIGALETTKNGETVTEYTNYEYLELKPLNEEINTLVTEFQGKIEILNYVELYK